MGVELKCCPRCGNDHSGDSIYICDRCHIIFCIKCGTVDFINRWNCPRCAALSTSLYGSINTEGEEEGIVENL